MTSFYVLEQVLYTDKLSIVAFFAIRKFVLFLRKFKKNQTYLFFNLARSYTDCFTVNNEHHQINVC